MNDSEGLLTDEEDTILVPSDTQLLAKGEKNRGKLLDYCLVHRYGK